MSQSILFEELWLDAALVLAKERYLDLIRDLEQSIMRPVRCLALIVVPPRFQGTC
jgi:hypothetical protein